MGVRVRGQSDYPWVRRAARGSKWQARPHVGPHREDYFNLGLYASDLAAFKVAVEFRRRRADRAYRGEDSCPAAVLIEMQAAGIVRADVLPRWVKRADDGSFRAYHKPTGAAVAGYADPVLCYRAVLGAIRRARAVARAARILALTENCLAA